MVDFVSQLVSTNESQTHNTHIHIHIHTHHITIAGYYNFCTVIIIALQTSHCIAHTHTVYIPVIVGSATSRGGEGGSARSRRFAEGG